MDDVQHVVGLRRLKRDDGVQHRNQALAKVRPDKKKKIGHFPLGAVAQVPYHVRQMALVVNREKKAR